MTCEWVGNAIVCTRGRKKAPACSSCRSPSRFQCDWKMPQGGTCDAYLCADHAAEVGPDRHLCPEHRKAYSAWLGRKAQA